MFRPLKLGALPRAQLQTFGLELADGPVHFTIPAQQHAHDSHGEDYLVCVPYLTRAIESPTYVGQSPKHKGKGFEVVLKTETHGLIILIAVLIKPTKNGVYFVKSCYPIKPEKLENRLQKGYLIPA